MPLQCVEGLFISHAKKCQRAYVLFLFLAAVKPMQHIPLIKDGGQLIQIIILQQRPLADANALGGRYQA